MSTFEDGFSLFRRDLDQVDAILGDDRARLGGSRILVTGATGFFGLWLTESLLHLAERHGLDIEVVGLSRNVEGFLASKGHHLARRPRLRFLQGSVLDAPLEEARATHVLHLASESNVENAPDWAGRHLASTLGGARRLLDLAAAGKAPILLTTSGAVYLNAEPAQDGRFLEGPTDPGDLASEKSVYGHAKRIVEVLGAVSAAERGHRVLIARCFAFVGPYLPLDANYAIGNFIGDALAGRDIIVGGDGTPLRSYLHASDLAGQLLKLLVGGRSAVPYNVGGEEAVSIADLAHRVARIAGTRSRVVVRQAREPGAVPNSYVPAVGRIVEDLGIGGTLTLDEAIARTIAWHRARIR